MEIVNVQIGDNEFALLLDSEFVPFVDSGRVEHYDFDLLCTTRNKLVISVYHEHTYIEQTNLYTLGLTQP